MEKKGSSTARPAWLPLLRSGLVRRRLEELADAAVESADAVGAELAAPLDEMTLRAFAAAVRERGRRLRQTARGA